MLNRKILTWCMERTPRTGGMIGTGPSLAAFISSSKIRLKWRRLLPAKKWKTAWASSTERSSALTTQYRWFLTTAASPSASQFPCPEPKKFHVIPIIQWPSALVLCGRPIAPYYYVSYLILPGSVWKPWQQTHHASYLVSLQWRSHR